MEVIWTTLHKNNAIFWPSSIGKINKMLSLSKIFNALILAQYIDHKDHSAWLTFPTKSFGQKFWGCNVTPLNFLGNFFPYQLNLLTNNKIIEEILLIDTLGHLLINHFKKNLWKKKKN